MQTTGHQKLFNFINAALDWCVLVVSYLLSVYIRQGLMFGITNPALLLEDHYIPMALVYSTLMVGVLVFLNMYGSYRFRSFWKETVSLTMANGFGVVALGFVLYFLKMGDFARWQVAFLLLFSVVGLVGKRAVLRALLRVVRTQGHNTRAVLLVGSGPLAHRYYEELKARPYTGYNYRGYVSDEQVADMGAWRGPVDQFRQVLQKEKIEEVVVALPARQADCIGDLVAASGRYSAKISIIPSYNDFIPASPHVETVADLKMINVRRAPDKGPLWAATKRLMDLGLGYLTLDRATATLSTGERQRMQLARAVRNRTTGVLYVLDEPSIGLHPSNIVGLTGVMHDLVADGNSVILVDHDTQILKEADWIVEMGPEAGAKGGHVIAQGTVSSVKANPVSQIGPFLSGKAETMLRSHTAKTELFAKGRIHLSTAQIHTVKPLEIDLPKGRLTVVTGVSGSGKSSLALGVLYAEGSRRYLDALSTYTRRRMTQAARAGVDEVLYVPAALALHQRPGVPGIRSTFGTGTELLNSLRLMYSRLASHRCPNGHYLAPSLRVAAGKELLCPECGAQFLAPSAEELAFNSQGACPQCGGIGTVRTVDPATLVPDDSLTIDEGAVAPWNSLMWSLMTDICREMGVRTNVPFRDLTAQEKEIVFHGPAEKKHIFYHNKNSNQAGELDFTYFNATYTVENALAKVKDEKGMKRVEKFLKEDICPACHGTRLSAAARAPKLRGLSLDEACRMPLSELVGWVQGVPDSLPAEMRPMAENIVESFTGPAKRLMDLGLGYLTLDRAASTLSTGERQRMQLARAVRNRTTGVLYVLDEPSIGLHPSNIVGLTGVMHDLIADGNSVILVDHDTQILKEADWIVEMGPEAGAKGGHVIAQGTIPAIEADPASQIGPFLSGKADTLRRKRALADALFAQGTLHLSTAQLHTVKPLEVDLPKGRLTVVTGVSGSGKTTLVLESLVPALEARIDGKILPPHVCALDAEGIAHVKLIDATPIGINVRSTVATYAGVHDDLRRLFARSPDAKAHGYKAGDFSYNTGSLRCPGCDGTGEVSLDVQFLPDVNIPCPDCRGSRYARAAGLVKLTGPAGQTASLPELMDMDVNTAIDFCRNMKTVCQKLKVLQQLGLGYLTLGEETPSLSGGEAQRLKLASEIGRTQTDSVFVFDEPSIGLHPLDVQVLLGVFQALLDNGATVVVIEHDLDVIRNADYIIDMGPGGGDAGGRIVACGTPEQICNDPASITGRYLRR